MSITTDSISKASNLGQIGFPEFTAKLVTDVFNAIISANMTQTQAYIELSKELAKTLTTYINDTKDQISGTDILNFLVRVVPDTSSQVGTVITKDSTKTLTTAQANAINTAVSIPNTTINNNVANTTSQIKDLYISILDSVASKISADKYTILQQMVKLGLVRLVVNNGEIQSALNFEAKDSTFYSRNSASYNREIYNFNSNTQSGWFQSLWNKYSTATYYSKLGISTTSGSNTAASSSLVQVTGNVKLSFSTDYQSLSTLTE